MATESASTAAPPDRQLVDAILGRGAEDAFRQLYRRHTPRIYQVVLRLVAWDPSAAEDVVQETWLRATRKLGSFHWNSRLATWLTAIAINITRERTRRQGARPRLVAVDDVTAVERQAPPAEPWRRAYTSGGDPRLDLERALAALPERGRQVVVLHDVEGYTHQEIGELLGIETGTSKSQLWKARQRLREFLSENDGRGETGTETEAS